MGEFYAERINADGTTSRYKHKRDYWRARIAGVGMRSAQRRSINRKTGGGTV